MRFWRSRAKMAVALVLVTTVGATPAWLVDRWVVRLAPLVSLALSLVLIVALLTWLDFDGLVRRWKQAEECDGKAET